MMVKKRMMVMRMMMMNDFLSSCADEDEDAL